MNRWPNPLPVPTLGDLLDSCVLNRSLAEAQLERFRQALQREQPGPGQRLSELQGLISQHAADLEHWGDYVGYYRKRIAKEGMKATVQGMAKFVASVGPVWGRPMAEKLPPFPPDRRLPREPGEDDEEGELF